MLNPSIKEADVKGGDGYFAPRTEAELRAIGGVVMEKSFTIRIRNKKEPKAIDEEVLEDEDQTLEDERFSD